MEVRDFPARRSKRRRHRGLWDITLNTVKHRSLKWLYASNLNLFAVIFAMITAISPQSLHCFCPHGEFVQSLKLANVSLHLSHTGGLWLNFTLKENVAAALLKKLLDEKFISLPWFLYAAATDVEFCCKPTYYWT